MKSQIQKTGLFHLVFLYGFTIFFYSGNTILPASGNVKNTNQQSQFHLSTPDFFCHTVPAEEITNAVQYLPVSLSKNPFGFQTDLSEKYPELRFQSILTCYFKLTENISPGLSIPEIVFPFHYFT